MLLRNPTYNSVVRRGRLTGLERWVIGLTLALIVPFLVMSMVPVYAGERGSRSTACLSNAKQLGLASVMYSVDWDDRLPVASSWMGGTQTYIKNKEAYRCVLFHGQGYGYSYLDRLDSAKLGPIESQADEPLILESRDKRYNSHGGYGLFCGPERHDGKNCVVYVDGHAVLRQREALFEWLWSTRMARGGAR